MVIMGGAIGAFFGSINIYCINFPPLFNTIF
jgi:hypothetical protein